MANLQAWNVDDNQINAMADKTQAYGLSGNDTLISDNKVDVLLIGGSGDDNLIMLGGKGTLSGGDGADTFELNYSATNGISAVIEDLDSASDKILVNFEGDAAPQLTSSISGDDVIWTDGDGLFNLTLKGVRENDYFDGNASNNIWYVLYYTNEEREKQNLSWLTMSEGLMNAASIRAQEITGLGQSGVLTDHTRPDGSDFSTVLDGKYRNFGENLDGGARTTAEVMRDWIGSASHYKNIMEPNFKKLGVGFNYYDIDESNHRWYWTQLFADSLNNPETVSTADLLTASITTATVPAKFIALTDGDDTYGNTIYGTTIDAQGGDDSISNSGAIVSISGGKGNDIIENLEDHVTINAGMGDDSIFLGTLTASPDSDYSIYSWAVNNLIEYTAGDGNDYIVDFSSTDTLRTGVHKRLSKV